MIGHYFGCFLKTVFDGHKLLINHQLYLHFGQLILKQAALSLIIKLTFVEMLVFSITNRVKDIALVDVS